MARIFKKELRSGCYAWEYKHSVYHSTQTVQRAGLANSGGPGLVRAGHGYDNYYLRQFLGHVLTIILFLGNCAPFDFADRTLKLLDAK